MMQTCLQVTQDYATITPFIHTHAATHISEQFSAPKALGDAAEEITPQSARP